MPSRNMRFHLSIVLAIVTVVTVATVLTLTQVWLVSSRAAKESVIQLFSEMGAHAGERVGAHLGQARHTADLGSAMSTASVAITGDGQNHPAVPLMRRMLDANPGLYSVYIGQADGSFLQIIRSNGREAILSTHKAPTGTNDILRAIAQKDGGMVQSWTFMNSQGVVIGDRTDADFNYDPRTRPWYKSAMDQQETMLTEPYVFNSLKRPGITASRRLSQGDGVFGVDIDLESLDNYVAQQKLSQHGSLFLLSSSGLILAAPPSIKGPLAPLADAAQSQNPHLRLAAKLREEGGAAQARIISFDGTDYVIQQSAWTEAGRQILICVVAPLDDFTGFIREMGGWIVVMTLAILVVVVPLTSALARFMSATVRDLADDAERIREMDFSGDPPRPSFIVEFQTLAEAFGLMKRTILGRTRDLEASQGKLRRLVEIGTAMSTESNRHRLMDMIVQEAKALTHADGCAVYLRDDQERLERVAISVDSLGLVINADPENDNPIHLLTNPETGTPLTSDILGAPLFWQSSLNIRDVRETTDMDTGVISTFDSDHGYTTQSVLILPLKPRGGEVMGVILLFNARDMVKGGIGPFLPSIQRFAESLSAQAASALQNHNLIDAQEALVDSMVRIVAAAIDAKSPYTGDHSSRVAELAAMIAEEASETRDGPLAAFQFSSPDDAYELRIAALLHDCGKVTTPEYVVDKATKLETIHNRIHDIRTRFEILLRDAEITRLKAVAAGTPADQAQADFDAYSQKLQADYAFIAQCNIGGEFMSPDHVARVKELAQAKWVRHFSDRLGLSQEEQRRMALIPEPNLPVTETLLADRPEHVLPWSGAEWFTKGTRDITTKVPDNMYNRGEIHNLCIPRGTLTDEERFKINEHVIQSIIMLEHLPFPKHLRHVPEYACAHHEAMNGRGYPRGLSARDMSIPARIMAVADVFEALTAADRPYKPAKTLSEAVDILAGFRDRQHIDGDIFALFLKAGLHLRYAERFLKPEQIDAVDVNRYLAAS